MILNLNQEFFVTSALISMFARKKRQTQFAFSPSLSAKNCLKLLNELSAEFSPAKITVFCTPASAAINKEKPQRWKLTHGCQTINFNLTTTTNQQHQISLHSHQQAAPTLPTSSTNVSSSHQHAAPKDNYYNCM